MWDGWRLWWECDVEEMKECLLWKGRDVKKEKGSEVVTVCVCVCVCVCVYHKIAKGGKNINFKIRKIVKKKKA